MPFPGPAPLSHPACSSPGGCCSSHLRAPLTSCRPAPMLLPLEVESSFQHYSKLRKARLQSAGPFGAILQLRYGMETTDTRVQSAAVPRMTCETLGKTLRISSSVQNKDDTYFFISSACLQTAQRGSCPFLGDCTATNNSDLRVTLIVAKREKAQHDCSRRVTFP